MGSNQRKEGRPRMSPLAAAVALLAAAIPLAAQAQTAPFSPTWESIDARPTPAWFTDAKFGVFICMGLSSVPAWSPKGNYSEWYEYWVKERSFDGAVADFHARNYGAGFEFKDFAPMFRLELWNPDDWADLVARSGAKYIVFTTKHHCGYTLWPNAQAEKAYGESYNPLKVGPKRDVVGEVVTAFRKRAIKVGLYWSLYEWYHPLWKTDKARYVEEHMIPQFRDLVTRYAPDIVWADGDWELPSAQFRSPELLAWLFNNAPNAKDVVINDRWGSDSRHRHGGFYTTEYGSGLDTGAHAWEENRGMGFSYSYNRAEDIQDYRSAEELILMLADIVSRGGNLCLDIGPSADGKIPVIMQERLLQIGAWLATNGEAIYGSRPAAAPCQWSAGRIPEIKRSQGGAAYDILKETLQPEPGRAVKEVLFTRKGNTLYAITPGWPGRTLRLKGIKASKKTAVTFLETGRPLHWKAAGPDLVVTLPEFDPNTFRSRCGYTFRVTGAAN